MRFPRKLPLTTKGARASVVYKPEKGQYLHPQRDCDKPSRSVDLPIMHFEAARLQSFPDSFGWCGSKIEIARQIGNAVPSMLAEALTRHLDPYLAGTSRTDSSIPFGGTGRSNALAILGPSFRCPRMAIPSTPSFSRAPRQRLIWQVHDPADRRGKRGEHPTWRARTQAR